MTSLQFFHPDSDDDAIALLEASRPPVDSPTQQRIRGELHLLHTFGTGRRRTDWVWAVRRPDDPTVLGVIAALGSERPDDRVLVLDHFGLPDDPAVAGALVAHATAEATSQGCDEVGIFAPAGAGLDDPALAALAGPLRSAGWRLLVERRHYEFEPAPDLAEDAPVSLRFERLSDPADPRLTTCHREVMRETLDAHDRALVERVGFDQACTESLAFLLDSDPVECLHLAFDEAGEVVGMVSGQVLPTGRAYVAFVGVPLAHRGHGYGRQLLAWQTTRLLAEGAITLIADTDNENLPMARAFFDIGWPQTETRIDLVR